MKNVSTSAGRLFSVLIEGGQPTVKDVMVAGHMYMYSLEGRFDSSQHMLICYRAWQADQRRRAGEMLNDDAALVRFWLHAHQSASEIGRRWLSNPSQQEFRVVLAARIDADESAGHCVN